jgi:hypothetical protein
VLDWYQLFLAALTVLWLCSTPGDRNALRIVLVASVGSALLVDGITRNIVAAWKLAIPGGVETVTILCLLKWAQTRAGALQAALLTVAWLTHLLCYVDVIAGSDLVYSRYEMILSLVSCAQLAAFHDTLTHIVRGLVAWWGAFRACHSGPVFSASLRHHLLRGPRVPRV